MSHFTTIKVQIKNSNILHQVLQEMGYQVECNKVVRGYGSNTTNAEYVVRQANGYDLGFRLKGENYELVADFWGVKIKPQEFVNSVTQKYAYKVLLASVKEDGFTIEEEETLQDGTIRVVVGRWI
ncbi:MAG: DUF1257 domain-containing protein [Cyanobacteria bacterium P01_D01_bin.50]